ncbi:MAG: hypothetical protein ACWGOW_06435 [Gammaproteobacteria bacterium]
MLITATTLTGGLKPGVRPSAQALHSENQLFAGTGGISPINRSLDFQQGFYDIESGQIAMFCFANVRPAPIHIMDGLPADRVTARNTGGEVISVKASVVSGFTRGGRYGAHPPGTLHIEYVMFRKASIHKKCHVLRQSDASQLAGYIVVPCGADALGPGKHNTASTTDMDTGLFGKGVQQSLYLKQWAQHRSSICVTCCSVINLYCPIQSR